MNPVIKKAIALSAITFFLFLAYYGSYLPMRKSMLFIDTVQGTGEIKTLADFEQAFSVPLDYPSPIGQEELVRNTANTTANSLQNISPEAVDKIMDFIENYYEPVVSRGRGMSFGQDLYLLGVLNEVAFLKTHKTQYINDSEKYFKEAQALGPKRPQGLYGLLDVYRIKGDIQNAKIVGGQILRQWPADAKTRETLEALATASSNIQVK